MRSPKISIVLCTCNGEAYLRGQIDSLLAQTYPFHELIVQDDCSTDSTGHIIRSYQQRYPERNIRFYANPQRMGFNKNFLTALQRAEGDYIACCDQDDIWVENKLETLVREMGDCPLIFHTSEPVEVASHSPSQLPVSEPPAASLVVKLFVVMAVVTVPSVLSPNA